MYPKEPSLITRPDFKRNNDTRPRPISFEIGSGYQAKKEPCCFHEEILKFRVDNVAKWIMLLSACLIKKLTFLSVSAFCSLFWAFLCSLSARTRTFLLACTIAILKSNNAPCNARWDVSSHCFLCPIVHCIRLLTDNRLINIFPSTNLIQRA